MMSSRRNRRPPSGRIVNHPNQGGDTFYTGEERIEKAERPRPKSAVAPLSNSELSDRSGNQQRSAHQTTKASDEEVLGWGRQNDNSGRTMTQRSDASELSMNEVLRRIREKSEKPLQEAKDRELELMGPYNAFSRPQLSSTAPLRTVLLDPNVNNFPRSRTRTELLKRIRAASIPHPSYDLDNDGYVSTNDYKLAKRFDLDGNGVLDHSERDIGKRVLAEEFFKRHAHELHLFGRNIATRSHAENVTKLVNSYSFERTYGKLLSVERTLVAESSQPMIQCMSDPLDPAFLSTTYYSDKLDASAWNDQDRLPRAVLATVMPQLHLAGRGGSEERRSTASWRPVSAPSSGRAAPVSALLQSSGGMTGSSAALQASLFSSFHPSNSAVHMGSRKRMLFARKELTRQELQSSSGSSSSRPAQSFGRVKMISDPRVENS